MTSREPTASAVAPLRPPKDRLQGPTSRTGPTIEKASAAQVAAMMIRVFMGFTSRSLSASIGDVLGSYFSGQITRSQIDYCSFLNKSWKMSWAQVRPRAYTSHPR